MSKVKVKENLRSKRKNNLLTPKGNPIKLSADFSAESLQIIMKWEDVFKMLKIKNFQPRILQLMSTQRNKYLAAIHEEK